MSSNPEREELVKELLPELRRYFAPITDSDLLQKLASWRNKVEATPLGAALSGARWFNGAVLIPNSVKTSAIESVDADKIAAGAGFLSDITISGTFTLSFGGSIESSDGLELSVEAVTITGPDGNVSLVAAASGWGAGAGEVFIGNATTAPTADPTGGGFLYVDAGALKWRGSSGTTTTIANA